MSVPPIPHFRPFKRAVLGGSMLRWPVPETNKNLLQEW